jgi:hypothetical protein
LKCSEEHGDNRHVGEDEIADLTDTLDDGAAIDVGVASCLPSNYNGDMSTLSEIEAVVDALPVADKQELLLFLAARLREQGKHLPPPRRFSREQMSSWITDDETDMQRFRGANPE